MQLIRDDLTIVMSLPDWVHISNMFIEGNRIIKQVEEVQNYKLGELLGSNLQHDSQKVIHYSSYDLSKATISLLLKGLNFSLPPKKLNLTTIFFLLNCYTGMFYMMKTTYMIQ